jgi:hypothetical protein
VAGEACHHLGKRYLFTVGHNSELKSHQRRHEMPANLNLPFQFGRIDADPNDCPIEDASLVPDATQNLN